MASSALKSILTILNVIQTIAAVILGAISIWYFTELKAFTDLRNRDTLVMDFALHWPQVLPILFAVISAIVVCVSGCGVYSSCSKRKSPLFVFVTFLSLVTLAAFAAGIFGLTCAISKESEDFISKTVSDAHGERIAMKDYAEAFGNIERRLRCCGVNSFNDYPITIPDSCCDSDDKVRCKEAVIRKFGCAKVAVAYTDIFMRYSSIGSLIVGVLCAMSIVAAVLSIRSSRNKSEKFQSQAEKEPLKLPL